LESLKNGLYRRRLAGQNRKSSSSSASGTLALQTANMPSPFASNKFDVHPSSISGIFQGRSVRRNFALDQHSFGNRVGELPVVRIVFSCLGSFDWNSGRKVDIQQDTSSLDQ